MQPNIPMKLTIIKVKTIEFYAKSDSHFNTQNDT